MAKIRYGRVENKYPQRFGTEYAAISEYGQRRGSVKFNYPRYEPNLSPDQFNPTLFNLVPGDIHHLAVDPNYQRQGIASNLVSLVERNYGEIGHRPPGDRPIPGDGPPMTHSGDLSDESYALANKVSSERSGPEVPTEYLQNGAGWNSEKRNEWAEKRTGELGGHTDVRDEHLDTSPSSPPAGKMSAAKGRKASTQLELPFTDGDS